MRSRNSNRSMRDQRSRRISCPSLRWTRSKSAVTVLNNVSHRLFVISLRVSGRHSPCPGSPRSAGGSTRPPPPRSSPRRAIPARPAGGSAPLVQPHLDRAPRQTRAGRHLRPPQEAGRRVRSLSVLVEQWRREYNTVRPHSACGGFLPAPEAIKPSPWFLRMPVLHGPPQVLGLT